MFSHFLWDLWLSFTLIVQGERTRVQNEGGSVIMNQGGWRVAAVLTVTRAIGK